MSNETLVLRGGRIVDGEHKTTRPADIVMRGGVIERVAPGAEAPPGPVRVVDVSGKVVAPGFIDSHLHIESSLLAPLTFARAAARRGTTAVFVDPHEIANVCGRAGIELFLRAAAAAPLDLYVGIPACVPATTLEDAGAAIGLDDIRALVEHPRVYGLAEMMNFPGIIHGVGDARAKVALVLRHGKLVDGHAPGLRGAALRTYVGNGQADGRVRIMSDHESRSAEEALDKRAAGMQVALRYGSASKDLPHILPGVLAAGADLTGFMLCSDDLDPVELYTDGHVDRIVRKTRDLLRAHGYDAERAAIEAIALATLSPARYFDPFFAHHGLPGMGAIAAGRRANLVVLDSLEGLHVEQVVHAGRLLPADEPPAEAEAPDYAAFAGPLHIRRALTPADFRVTYHGPPRTVDARVIGLTDGIATTARTVPVAARDGEALAPPGTARIAVIERHHDTGTLAVGFVERCLATGAIASTVAHDSHNLIVIGVDEAAMAQAANFLREHGGGMVAVGADVAYLPLRIGGLMSDESLEAVVRGYRRLQAAVQALGGDPGLFMRMSFLALPVIPELRLTNRGLVDVNRFALVEPYAA